MLGSSSLARESILRALLSSFVLLVMSQQGVRAQEKHTPEGVRVLQNKSYDDSDAARREILELYKDLRVTDVCDGMDLVGLQDIGLMDSDIRPLWKDTEHFTHRFIGIAVTARYVPSNKPPAGRRPTEQFDKWVGHWYSRRSPCESWLKELDNDGRRSKVAGGRTSLGPVRRSQVGVAWTTRKLRAAV